jgi:hypothetical protein
MFLGYNVPAAFKLKFGWFPAPERSQPFKLLVCILSVSKRQPTKDDSMQKLAAARPGWPGDTELDKRVGRNIENGLPIHARGVYYHSGIVTPHQLSPLRLAEQLCTSSVYQSYCIEIFLQPSHALALI